MPAEFDSSEFVDRDYEAAAQSAYGAAAAKPPADRPASREELDAKVSETQQRLVELKRIQEQLERERAALEEARRRQTEFQNGRTEMLEHLTRGLALLEEAEFAARRDAEQMTKTLAQLRDAFAKIQAIREDSWTREDCDVQLTRALTTLENARMEWNSAQLKWPILTGGSSGALGTPADERNRLDPASLESISPATLARLGLALTWPLALVAVLVWATLVLLLFRG